MNGRRSSEDNDQRHDQSEKCDGFHQREAQHGHGEDLAAGGGVATNGCNEGCENPSNADTWANHADNSETGTNHLCSFEFHIVSSPFEKFGVDVSRLRPGSVQIQGVLDVQAGQDREYIGLQECDENFESGYRDDDDQRNDAEKAHCDHETRNHLEEHVAGEHVR